MSVGALEALDAILADAGDADDVLRAAVGVLAAEPGISWAGIRFLDEGVFVLGPASGEPDESHRTATPISYQGEPVGELVVDGAAAGPFLTKFAQRISAYVLLGWDTGGEAWDP